MRLLMVQKSCVHQLRLVVESPFFNRVLYMPGGAGFLPSTGGKSTINSEKTTTLAGGYEGFILSARWIKNNRKELRGTLR